MSIISHDEINVLHICSYFNTSKLYFNLFQNLENINKSITQTVYIPMYKGYQFKSHSSIKNKVKNTDKTKFVYDEVLNSFERFFLLKRSYKTYNKLLKRLSLDEFDLVHAHSFFYNGLVASIIHDRYRIPFIVAFRQTDLEVLTKLPYAGYLFSNILKNSSSVVFISYSLYQKTLAEINNAEIKKELKDKSIIIPNGLEQEFLNQTQDQSNSPLKLKKDFIFIYQGSFLQRKNIIYSLKLVKQLVCKGYNIKFNIYGSGPEKENIHTFIRENKMSAYVTLGFWSDDINEIIRRYDSSHVFIMPSLQETFGISYLEALSRKCAVVHLENEGISGFFESNSVVELVGNFEDDLLMLEKLILTYEMLSFPKLESFSWRTIAGRYKILYFQKFRKDSIY